MNDNEYIAKAISEQLKGGFPLVLVSIVDLQGSSPRHNGAKMVVTAEKNFGTIGGSLLEATAISESRAVLARKQSRLMHFDLTGSGVYSKGMICGGRAVLLLDFVPASKENIELFEGWHEAVSGGQDFFYLTGLKGSGDSVSIISRCLLYLDGKMSGQCPGGESGIENLKSELHNVSATTIIDLPDGQVIVDPIRKLKILFCCGAGHVALPTVHIAALAGFQVVVLDDRADFANNERFPDASKIAVIKEFKQALEGLEIDQDSFIVILTRGHQYDREVLQQSLKTRAGYIGMISSRKKRDAIYTALLEEGVTREDLARVHSPIGLAIGAETPEEIAVSIVAELISESKKQSK